MLRNEYIKDAEFTAANLDVSAPTVRNIFKVFNNKTAIGGDHLNFSHAAVLPDVALQQWGLLLQQSFSS